MSHFKKKRVESGVQAARVCRGYAPQDAERYLTLPLPSTKPS